MAVHYAEPEIERMVSDVEQGMAPSCAPVNGTLLLPGLEDIAARRAPVPSFVVYGLDLSQLPSLYHALASAATATIPPACLRARTRFAWRRHGRAKPSSGYSGLQGLFFFTKKYRR